MQVHIHNTCTYSTLAPTSQFTISSKKYLMLKTKGGFTAQTLCEKQRMETMHHSSPRMLAIYFHLVITKLEIMIIIILIKEERKSNDLSLLTICKKSMSISEEKQGGLFTYLSKQDEIIRFTFSSYVSYKFTVCQELL